MTDTRAAELCRGTRDQAADHRMRPLMQTESEALLERGLALGAKTFSRFLKELGWSREMIDHTFFHQVSELHRRLTLASLRLDASRDYATVSYLGNTGSAALPVSLALAIDEGVVKTGERLALLGVGSGINTIALGVHWNKAAPNAPGSLRVSESEPHRTGLFDSAGCHATP